MVDKRKPVDIVCLDTGKSIGTVSQNILVEKQKKYGLDEQTVRWIKNCLNDWHQRVISGGIKSSGSVQGPVPFTVFSNN